MMIRKINQLLINVLVVVLLVLMAIAPIVLIAYSWSFAGIGSLLFLIGYWYMYNMITELR